MCIGRPSPPPLPEAEPLDSPIEQTADKVVVGSKKKSAKMKGTSKLATFLGRKRFGTQSLQIPLLNASKKISNLNYPN
jgi:hypothetical protein